MKKALKVFLILLFAFAFVFSGIKILKYYLETQASKKITKSIIRR